VEFEKKLKLKADQEFIIDDDDDELFQTENKAPIEKPIQKEVPK
jgi:hypothetical protein